MGVAVGVLLFAGAWFGHAFLMTVWLNWWYGVAMPRPLHKLMRALVALTVFGFPLILAWDYWRTGDSLFVIRHWSLGGYLLLCWTTAFVYLPVITVVRSRRRDPAQVVA